MDTILDAIFHGGNPSNYQMPWTCDMCSVSFRQHPREIWIRAMIHFGYLGPKSASILCETCSDKLEIPYTTGDSHERVDQNG